MNNKKIHKNEEESYNEISMQMNNNLSGNKFDFQSSKKGHNTYNAKYSLLSGIDNIINKFNLSNKKERNFVHEVKTEIKQFSKKIILESPNELFEFIISNSISQLKVIFIEEIKNIIKIMEDILYTHPYPIEAYI